jgi:acetyl esterase/lipase
MPSLRSRLARLVLKQVMRFADPRLSWDERRRSLDRAGRWVRRPRGTQVGPGVVGGASGEWITPAGAPVGTILYLHGGGYVLGSCVSHRGLAAQLARVCGARVFLLRYRLAPEHPFPAALEDALAAYRGLLGQGVGAERLAIAGDSAGGGLTLATLVALRDAGDALPVAGICLSPWTDLAGSGETIQANAACDIMLRPGSIPEFGDLYRGDRPATDPLVSPLYANLRGLPPLLVHVGAEEILLADSTRLAERARVAGVDVTLTVLDGMWHVWHTSVGFVPESRAALREIGEFLRARWAVAGPAPAPPGPRGA